MHRDAGPPLWKCICINFLCGVHHCDSFIRYCLSKQIAQHYFKNGGQILMKQHIKNWNMVLKKKLRKKINLHNS